ncbi:hypothetical protein JCM11491_000896 [Sporobolomyces phaffii]
MPTISSFAVIATLLSSTLAAPLSGRAVEETTTTSFCSPRFEGNHSTHISLSVNTRTAWKWISAGADREYPTDTEVTDVGTMIPNPPGTDLTISQWYGASDQYRIGVGKFDNVETCLGGRDDRISGADCDSSLAAWTFVCEQCTDAGAPLGNCYLKATQVGTCATFSETGRPMNLTECLPLTSSDPNEYYVTGQQFLI